jgi:aromatic-amino-acid transaminase
MFEHVEPYAGDPIFALVDAFNADPRPHKVNLSIGIYFDEDGRLPVLPLFGPRHAALAGGRVATIQSVGSSGGLKVGADFLRRWFPGSEVWISDPSWDNHRSMFEGSGFTVKAYPYYDAATGGVRFEAMLAAIEQLPARTVVLLHACCHNPTGVDLGTAQWDRLIPVLKRRELIPYLDLAYQGFGDGLEQDAYAVRAMAATDMAFIVANSFSKSMSVYGERCGALSVVCPTAREADLVLGQLKLTVRRIYSSPAIHSAGIMALVLGEPTLRAMWEVEVGQMRERILAMRKALHAVLSARVPGRDFGYLLSQRGMFSYTGLSAAQVDRLREESAVYLIRSGRMCVAGLNHGNVERTAQAMAAVMT